MCIIQFDWLIAVYVFISLVRNASFLIVKNSGVREELSDVVFFYSEKNSTDHCARTSFWYIRVIGT